VIAKQHRGGDCGAAGGRHLTYYADEGRLPVTWNEDAPDAAAAEGVQIVETRAAELVEIRLLHAAAVVSLRLAGRYYSVSVLLPSFTLRAGNSSAELAAAQLCRAGCPRTQLVDLDAFFRRTARRQAKAKRTTTTGRRRDDDDDGGKGAAVLPLRVAVSTCGEAAGLYGYLADSCVFDVLNTGDLSFARLSSRAALTDVRRAAVVRSALANHSIAATVARRLEAEADVTSSADSSLLFLSARCRRWKFRSLSVVVVSASLIVLFTEADIGLHLTGVIRCALCFCCVVTRCE